MTAHARTAFLAAVCLVLASTLSAAQSEPLLTEDEVEGVLGMSVQIDSRGNNGFILSVTYPTGRPTGITDLEETAVALAKIAAAKL